MNDVHKLVQIQSNLLDSMLAITESIKRDTDRRFVREIDQETQNLLRLVIAFDKLRPKYI